MTHKDEQWEKEIRKGPFASSPFTEDHKRKVLQQVEWMKKSEEGSKGDRPEKTSRSSRPFRPQVKNASHKRRLRRGSLVAGTGALVIAAGLFLWIWDDGQLVKPVIEQVYPTAALQLSDGLNTNLLTDKMKRNVATTMRDDLGKQLKITKVEDLPVSGRIYVEAGNESEKEYAQIWLDATTGNLRELGMRREMQPSELEHRYLRQVPSLLQSIGSTPTLKPVSVQRFVSMKQGELEPISHTTLTLENETGDGYGEIVWQQDKAVSITGDLRPDQVSQAALTDAEDAVNAVFGETSLKLRGVSRSKDDEIRRDIINLSFNDHYLVQMTVGEETKVYSIIGENSYRDDFANWDEVEAYHQKIYDVKESLLRDEVAPMIKEVFNVNLDGYSLHREADNPGIAIFELESPKDVIRVRYNEDVKITMITRGEL
ncbi:hypothetical protein EL84_08500 [Paenibacillus sp. VT-400]|uniref:hypothetical protein n=1 Tax=Paenibacillus sp. VT-400 TaxID=1495853 RepID=UPI000649EF11|nr:hypothetical protein [Paenibacillus sp. VT-400]KLU56759.1 hypothetical protein EL84_08500 [Paenibacillus sp. VT-400]